VDVAASGDTVEAGSSNTTITASTNTSGLDVMGGTGTLSFIGLDAGTTTYIVGGSGAQNVSVGGGYLVDQLGAGENAVVTSGLGSALTPTVVTLLGASGSNVTFYGTQGGALFTAKGGTETINAGGSFTQNTRAGGSGPDLLIAGGGNSTLISGTGQEVFEFDRAATNNTISGPVSDVVNGFSSANDTVDLVGYGTTASVAYRASVVGGDVVVLLNDRSTITFTGITHVSDVTNNIVLR
jgi:hypothetical protein